MQPNRPDALGAFPQTRFPLIGRVAVLEGFQASRYADAINRLVERLLFKQEVAKGQSARGKRRNREQPTQRSNTLRVYLKAVERWSAFSVGMYGRELDPREVESNVAIAYGKWLRGEGPGPDIRGSMVKALGQEYVSVYQALEKAGGIYGQVNITQVVEALDADSFRNLVEISSDASNPIGVAKVHRMLGKLVRAFRTIARDPNSEQIRAEEGRIGSKREKDPYTYTYTILPQEACSSSSVAVHVGALSAVWAELTAKTSEDQPPLAFNPWKSVYARWAYRAKVEKENAKARGEFPILTTAIVKSMLNAARGISIERRRDTLALLFLAILGLRAEELAGLLRKDLINIDGVLNLAVLGKGNKIRQIPLYSTLRDAVTLLTGRLEEEAEKTYIAEDGGRTPSYDAIYARSLLSPEAPLVPSLTRWGCNQKNVNPNRSPELDALEPLDVSGVRAMLDRIAKRARVREPATDVVRPLAPCDKTCRRSPCRHEMRRVHPHAFRHYAATGAQQAGIPLQDVQEILGHSDIRTTQIYIQVSPQKSMAFSAGVCRTLNRQAAMTAEEVASLRTTGMNPLEDTQIVEAEPEDDRQSGVAAYTEKTPESARVIAAPMWAYQGEKLSQYLPSIRGGRKPTANAFMSDVKSREGMARLALTAAYDSGNTDAYSDALARLSDVQARYIWNTFRIGQQSRLPWFCGRANRWKQGQMAPLVSYAQIAPEDREQAEVVVQIKALYDEVWADQGPSSASALVSWLTEIVKVASTQFAKDMIERGDTWVLFEDEALLGDESVVREHAVEPILEWFENTAWLCEPRALKAPATVGTSRSSPWSNCQNGSGTPIPCWPSKQARGKPYGSG